MTAREKVLSIDALVDWRSQQEGNVVLTNGCFDIVHIAHLRCLEYARSLGDRLVVAINSDSSVKALKGESRPYIKDIERAELIAGFECVDAVVIFSDPRLDHVITKISPDVYAKGGDYTVETMDQGERRALESCEARICFNPNFLRDITTTNVVHTILEKNG